jgi:cation transport ATPase
VNFLRDCFTLFAQIGLNIVSIHYLRKHLAKKSAILNKSSKSAINKPTQQSSSAYNDSITKVNQSTSQQKKAESVEESQGKAKNKEQILNKTELKTTIMVTLISVFSILEHTLMLLSSVYRVFYTNLFGIILVIVAVTWLLLKHASNFFILYAFNKNFKKDFKQIFLQKLKQK